MDLVRTVNRNIRVEMGKNNVRGAWFWDEAGMKMW